ncbi:MAG: flagella basal body P-ring formation protein FlgA [Burkholderiales bacterium PBB4]|nr:MAG: flagella basal body P-ring formation protein FlgA [Burkholderiales bacterium PBB4]
MAGRFVGWVARLSVAWCVAMSPSWAQEVGSEIQSAARIWVAEAVQTASSAASGAMRMEVSLGSLDPRLKLAPCGNMESYLPPGSKLWGKARVGVRCVDGITRWNVTLPVTVNAWGKAWVVRHQLPTGAVIGPDDVVEAEVNWAEEPSAILRDPALWSGFQVAKPLSTGQALRANMVRPAQVFQVGSPVRVVAQGAGFQIASDGQALTAGVVGQSARVRMESGRVASGTVLDVKTVKIDL